MDLAAMRDCRTKSAGEFRHPKEKMANGQQTSVLATRKPQRSLRSVMG